VRRPGRNVAVQHFLLGASLGLDGGADRGGRLQLRAGPAEKEKRHFNPDLSQQNQNASTGKETIIFIICFIYLFYYVF